jgi:hypothetical protein
VMSRLRCRLPGDRESGQLATGLIILVFFGMLLVIFKIILPIGQATDQKAGAQSAADAAALAGAKQIGDDLPAVITAAAAVAPNARGLLELLSGLAGGYGAESATDFAGRNGNDVTFYNYSRFADQVEVRVKERRTTKTGDHAVAQATAALGLRLGPCEFVDEPTPTPTITPTPDDDPPPGPASDTDLTVRCGELELDFVIDGGTGRPRLDTDLDDLEDRIEPKLIG